MKKQCFECIYCKDNGVWLYCDNKKQRYKRVNEIDKCELFTPYPNVLIETIINDIVGKWGERLLTKVERVLK